MQSCCAIVSVVDYAMLRPEKNGNHAMKFPSLVA